MFWLLFRWRRSTSDSHSPCSAVRKAENIVIRRKLGGANGGYCDLGGLWKFSAITVSAQSLSRHLHSLYHGIFTVPIPSSPQSLSRHLHSPYPVLSTVPITALHSPYPVLSTVPITASSQSLYRPLHSHYHGIFTVPIAVSARSLSRSLYNSFHGIHTVPVMVSKQSTSRSEQVLLLVFTQPPSWSLHIPFRRLFILPMPALVTLDPRKQGPQQFYIKVIQHNRKINQTRYAIENCALLGQTTPEDGTDKLSRNADEKLPLLTA